MWRADSFGKDPDAGRLRAGGEGSDKWWDGWMALPTQWTWTWANSGREWTADNGVTNSSTWLSKWTTTTLFKCWLGQRKYCKKLEKIYIFLKAPKLISKVIKLLIIKVRQTKTTMRQHFLAATVAKFWKINHSKCCWEFPSHLGTRDQFRGRQFFHEQARG